MSSFDTNNEIVNVDIRCNGLDIINVETISTFEFDLNDYDLSMCDETLVVDVTSTDKAGNSLFVQQTLDIDFDQPEIHLTSSCYLDATQAKIVIVPSCSIRISVADDSTLSRTLFIQAGSMNYSAYDTILLSFNEILNGQDEMRLFITATDIVNRSVTQNFLFIDQNTIDVGISSQTCNKDEVQCVANSVLGYDILLTSDAEIDISISNDYEDIPFVDTYGTVCLEDSPLNCYEISQFPYNTSELDDGYWTFEFAAIDALGRNYSTNRTLLIDTEDIRILATEQFASNTALNLSVIFLCDTCYTTIEIFEHHRPNIEVNVLPQFWSMTENQENIWILKVETSTESISTTDSELKITATSQSGDEVKFVKPLENINPIFIMPRLADGIECNDSPESFIESDESLSNYICAFNNTKSGIVTLFIDVETTHPSDLVISSTQCFLQDGCSTTEHRYDRNTQTVELNLAVIKSKNSETMIYTIGIMRPFDNQQNFILVELIDKDSFTTLMELDEHRTTYINITEQGQLTLTSALYIETSLSNGKVLKNNEFMSMMKTALEKSECQIIGTRMKPIGDGEVNYEKNSSVFSTYQNCNLVVDVSEGKLYLRSNMDWSSEFAVNNNASNGLPFYLLDPEEFRIQFDWPVSNNQETISFVATDSNIVYTVVQAENQPPEFSEECNAFTESSKSVEEGFNKPKLLNCMYSIEDLDGVEYIGLEMKFNDKNTTVLCEVSLLTAWGLESGSTLTSEKMMVVSSKVIENL